jgi:LacI family transcriptional regulator
VLIALPTAWASYRAALDGVIRFTEENDRYVMLYSPGRDKPPPDLDGVICRPDWLATMGMDLRLERGGPMAVAIADDSERIPRVGADNLAVGALAYRHFRDRGFVHLAYCGPDQPTSRLRSRGLIEAAAADELAVHTFYSRAFPFLVAKARDRQRLGRWLENLPKPVGLFVWTDAVGHEVLEICRQRQLTVPDEIAVLGVDNDRVACHLAYPRLSSVDLGAGRWGYEAARILDRMLDGQPAPAGPTLIRPVEVATRASTDVLAVRDPSIREAVRFIREHAGEPITVTDVARHVHLSRRRLETRLREALGQSPKERIDRERVRLAQSLLRRTNMTQLEIALRCGFRQPSRLSEAFKRLTGRTPSEERQRHGPNAR